MGYRRIRDKIEHDHGLHANDKRILRICRKKRLRSVIKGRHNCCTRFPEYGTVKKVYLSAILDLCDRRPVAYVIGDSNNNQLVFQTFDKALEANPGAHPLFHSDRGFQYTNKLFRAKIEQAGMTQSMSRVAHCLDNGPMEGFWGILKREMYYRRRFTSRQELVESIEEYIRYYTYDRPQRHLGIRTPSEYHEKLVGAA